MQQGLPCLLFHFLFLADCASFVVISLFHELPARGGSLDHAGESEIISNKAK
jgi:hypothetical protein